MAGIRSALVAALADGTLHSGVDLAKQLGCSRTAVWKHLNELQSVGLQIDAQRGAGYRLRRPLELLDPEAIRAGLDDAASESIGRLEVHESIDSTSERLRALPLPAAGRFDAVLAEYQTGGRGRRGRQWLSPFGAGLCLSVNHWFEFVPATMSALSLAIGAGVCHALRDEVGDLVGLKWPNDIVAGGRKLGGLLVDVQGEADGPVSVVIGLGLNFDGVDGIRDEVRSTGGLPPVSLLEIASGRRPSRNGLAARLINEFHSVATEFEQNGFMTFVDEWRRYDSLVNQPVTARIGRRAVTGTARGIADDGALLIDCDGELQRIVSGEVSLRPDGAVKI